MFGHDCSCIILSIILLFLCFLSSAHCLSEYDAEAYLLYAGATKVLLGNMPTTPYLWKTLLSLSSLDEGMHNRRTGRWGEELVF